MNLSEIARLRLVSQRLVGPRLNRPDQVVSWMGAIQAQDLPMSLWAVGVRMRKASMSSVATALNRGTILRTHLLRPTWHLVPARDLGWMLDLTAPQVRKGVAARHRQLGLTTPAIKKSNDIIERTIATLGGATRAQLIEALVAAGFPIRDNRMAHLLMLAELDQLMCSGPIVDDGPTYALMSERVKRPVRMERDEALRTLVTRFLNSHGPATHKDYAWWSGLAMRDVHRSFDMVRRKCGVSLVDGREYWHRRDLRDVARGMEAAILLPAYDEFTIAYVDRTESIVGGRARAISGNGVFRPMVVVDGKVVGIWRRGRTKRGFTIQVSVFERPSSADKAGLERAAERYAAFSGGAVEVSVSAGTASRRPVPER
jgi:hypothetical protein